MCAKYNSLVSAVAAVEVAHALRSRDKSIANFLAPALREADSHLCAATATTMQSDTKLSHLIRQGWILLHEMQNTASSLLLPTKN